MSSARIALISPPILKPSEPGLSGAAAAKGFQECGVDAFYFDANLGWFHHALRKDRLEGILANMSQASREFQAFRQAVDKHAGIERLQSPGTYQDKKRYSSAINNLTQALQLASQPFPGFQLRVGDLEIHGLRPQSAKDLLEVSVSPTPFDEYYLQELLPQLEAQRVTHVGLSLTFLNQAFGTFRLAALLKQHCPNIQRLLGGPLLACWQAVGADLRPFHPLFDQLFVSNCPGELEALAADLGGQAAPTVNVLSPSLEDVPWQSYLTPRPTVPVAFGRGCYYRRCAFCPDYLHPAYHGCPKPAIEAWLQTVGEKFPAGAMLHLTDSALSPAQLNLVAIIIKKHQLNLKWHGFARMEARFANPTFMEHLHQGGCTMLQWGLECASPRLLALMDKGLEAERAGAVLEASASAGIKNHAYLLFGLPTETESDREMTLRFVQQKAHTFHSLNAAILNLPRRSPMHLSPECYGITEFSSWSDGADLSLYLDFKCGDSHPRLEARRWLGSRFLRDTTVKDILGHLNGPFKENHGCFL